MKLSSILSIYRSGATKLFYFALFFVVAIFSFSLIGIEKAEAQGTWSATSYAGFIGCNNTGGLPSLTTARPAGSACTSPGETRSYQTGTGICTTGVWMAEFSRFSQSCVGVSINGRCSATPETCIAGTPGWVGSIRDTATTYEWRCDGSGGGTTAWNCSAPKPAPPVNGSCGGSNGGSYASRPGSGLCSSGSLTWTDTSGGDGAWNWRCNGSSGGSTAWCAASVASTPVNGSCGGSNGGTYTSRPSSGLCSSGTRVWTDTVGSDGRWNWRCDGIAGGSTQWCMANVAPPPVNGSCGSSHTDTVTSRPSSASEVCSAGSQWWTDSSATDGVYNWQCQGVSGGSTASCFASRTSVSPNPNLRISSNVRQYVFPGPNPYHTHTIGVTNDGGRPLNYSTAVPGINFFCSGGGCANSLAAGQTRTMMIMSYGCNTFPRSSSVNVSWTPATTVLSPFSNPTRSTTVDITCAPPPTPVNGQCGTNNGGTFSSTPSGSNCSRGSLSWQDSSGSDGTYNWRCNGSSGGANASCSATRSVVSVNGVCGSASGSSFASAPATNLCSSGTNTSVSPTGSGWQWSCIGSGSGSNDICSATQTVAPTIPNPPTVNASCGSASFSSSGATYYQVRVDNTSNGWSGSCTSLNPGDDCNNNVGSPYSFSTQPGASYNVWAHACNSAGCSPAAGSDTTSCPVASENGSCGSADGGSYPSAPSSGLCSSSGGNTPVTTDGTNWSWTCNGSGAGTSQSCSAVDSTPPPDRTLDITKTGPAAVAGTVELSSGADCTSSCTRTYTDGTSVTLTGDITNGDVSFTGPGCSGSNSCTLTMNTYRSVDASFTCDGGYELVGSSCILSRPDLEITTFNLTPDAGDPLTVTYNSATEIRFTNSGAADIPFGTAVPYRLAIDEGNSGTSFTRFINLSHNAGLTSGDPVGTGPLTPTILDLPAGATHRICLQVDHSDAIDEEDEGNNESCVTTTLSYPAPNLTLDSDPTLVRRDGSAVIDWEIGAGYTLNCVVTGPGGTNYSFTHSGTPASPNDTDSRPTGPLQNFSVFTLTCTDPGDTSHTTTANVEVIPSIQEI